MSCAETAAMQRAEPAGISPLLTFVLALACGAGAANLYYAQPLIGLIAPDIGLGAAAASLIVTVTQIGYGLGLTLLVPLGDLLENRRLIVTTLMGALAALALAAAAPSAAVFLAASLAIGLGSCAVQMLVPMAAHMAPERVRGQVVGNVMSGLLLGIMLARPLSSFVADLAGWRVMFAASAGLMAALALLLWRALPRRQPAGATSYGALLASLWTVLRTTPVLQRRAAYQAALFGCFSLFWTTAPLQLAGPAFGMSQRGIALFALAGAAGAVAAPLAGRLADRGWSRIGTPLAMLTVIAAFLLARTGSLAAMVAAGILVDFGAQANLVFGQRAIYGLGAAVRSRLNGLYMAIFFAGGAVGSALGGQAFSRGGWEAVCWVGVALPALALALVATERSRA